MNSQSPPREILRPIAQHFYHDGAPCVPLSPTAGARNAVILYKAFEGVSDKIILRADYNVLGKPYVFFAGKEKKLKNIPVANVNAERAEMKNIFRSIGDAALKKFEGNIPVYSAVIKLKMIAISKSLSRDFHVGDVREVLGVISSVCESASIIENHQKKVSKHRTTEPDSSALRDLRLRKFIKYLNETPGALMSLIRILNPHTAKDELATTTAILSVKNLIKDFLDLHSHKKISYQSFDEQKVLRSQQSPEKKSLTACVKRQADNPHLQLFAKLWNKMKQDPGLRGIVSIHSWAAELSIIADLVLENSQGSTAEKLATPTQTRQLYKKNSRNSPASLLNDESSRGMNSPRKNQTTSNLTSHSNTPESESGYETAHSSDEDSASDDSPYKG